MVDTPRTIDDMRDNLFQDGQPDNSITANYIRDLLVSIKSKHGALVLDAPVVLPISTSNTWEKLNGTFTLAPESEDFIKLDDNELQYKGSLTQKFQIRIDMSNGTTGGTNRTICSQIAINDAVQQASEMCHIMDSGDDVKQLSTVLVAELNTDDFVSVYLNNVNHTNDLNIESCKISVISLIT